MQVEFTTTVLRGFPVTVTAEFEGEELREYTLKTANKRRAKWLERKVQNSVDHQRVLEQAYEHYWNDRG